MTSSRRRERLLVPFVAVVAVAVGLWAGRPYAVGVFHDDGIYAILAKALATNQGYRYLHLPGAPAATHYPPGYPFFLSLIWRIWPSFPQNIRLMLAANALLLGAIAVSVEYVARRVLAWPKTAAACAALVAAISYPLIMLSSLVLSETLFVALLMPSLVLAERVVRDDSSARWSALWTGICCGLLVLVRTHGAALVLALIVCLAMRRRFRALMIVAVAAAAIIAPWQLWSMLHVGEITGPLTGSYGSYVAWLAEGAHEGGVRLFAHAIALNARELVALIADRVSLADSAGVRLVCAWLATGLAGIGAFRMARKAPVTILFLAIYLGVVLMWPYAPWRFFFAVWPLVVLSIGEAVVAAVAAAHASREQVGRRTSRMASIAVAAIAVLVVAGAVREEVRAYRGMTWRESGAAATAQIGPVVNWARTHTSSGDIIAAEGEQVVYLFAGRRAVPLTSFTASEYMAPRPMAEDAAMMMDLIGRFDVSYVVTISPPLAAAADSLVGANASQGSTARPRLVALDGLSGGRAYRVDRD
jgi:hypothetical protein